MKSSTADQKPPANPSQSARSRPKVLGRLAKPRGSGRSIPRPLPRAPDCLFCDILHSNKTLSEKIASALYKKFSEMITRGQSLLLDKILRKKHSKTFLSFREIEFEAQKNLFRRYYFTGEFRKKFQNVYRYLNFAIVAPQVYEPSRILKTNKLVKRKKREELLRKVIDRVPEAVLETLDLPKLLEYEGMKSILIEGGSPATPILHGLDTTKIHNNRNMTYLRLFNNSFDQPAREMQELSDFNEESVMIPASRAVQMSQNLSFVNFFGGHEDVGGIGRKASEEGARSRAGDYLLGFPESQRTCRGSEKTPASLDDVIHQRTAFTKKTSKPLRDVLPEPCLPDGEIKPQFYTHEIYRSKTENGSEAEKNSGQGHSIQTKANSDKDSSTRAKELAKAMQAFPSDVIRSDFQIDCQIELYTSDKPNSSNMQDRFGSVDPEEPFNGIIYKANSLKVTPKIKTSHELGQGRLSSQNAVSQHTESEAESSRSQPFHSVPEIATEKIDVPKLSAHIKDSPSINPVTAREETIQVERKIPNEMKSLQTFLTRNIPDVVRAQIPPRHPTLTKLETERLLTRKPFAQTKTSRNPIGRFDTNFKKLSIKTSSSGVKPGQAHVESPDHAHDSRKILTPTVTQSQLKIKDRSDVLRVTESEAPKPFSNDMSSSSKIPVESQAENYQLYRPRVELEKVVGQTARGMAKVNPNSKTIFGSRSNNIRSEDSQKTGLAHRDFIKSQELLSFHRGKHEPFQNIKFGKVKVPKEPLELASHRPSLRESHLAFKPEMSVRLTSTNPAPAPVTKRDAPEPSDRNRSGGFGLVGKRSITNSSTSVSRRQIKEPSRAFYGDIQGSQSVVLGPSSSSSQIRTYLSKKKKF